MKKLGKGLAVIMVIVLTFVFTAVPVFAAEDWEGYKAAVIAEIPEDTENYDQIVAEIQAVTTATAGNLSAGAVMIEEILESYGLSTTVDVDDYIDEFDSGGVEANVIISETVAHDTLVIEEGEVYGAPEGYLLTMLVDGVETNMYPGEYTNVILVVTPDTGHIGSYTGRGEDPYRAALFIRDGAVVAELSVLDAITAGEYSDTEATGLVIGSQSASFSSVMIVNSDYTLSGLDFNADTDSDGSGDANDFSGLGAIIGVYGDSVVIIEDSNINTTGVAQPALFVDGGAAVLVRNSTLYADGGTLYEGYINTADQTIMVSPPWVLGIGGNSRTTNVMGENTLAAYVDTTVGARAWGALSTDAGQNMGIVTINAVIEVAETGYGTYIIGNAQEYFYGTTFNVATYASILTGGAATYTSYTGGQAIDITQVDGTVAFPGVVSDSVADGEEVPTVVNSQAFGIMAHNTGTINVENGTIFNTEDTVFLLKVGGVEVNVDNSQLNTGNGVILQLMDNDDPAVGVYFGDNNSGPFFNDSYSEPEGYPGIDYEVEVMAGEETSATVANLTNGEHTGDLFNSSGYVGNAAVLQVNLGAGATLNGVISATSAMHWYNGQQATSFTWDEPEKIGQLQNQPYYNGVNDVNVTLAGGAVWNITGDCYVTSVDVQDGTIKAASPVTVYYADSVNVPDDVENVTFTKIGESTPATSSPESITSGAGESTGGNTGLIVAIVIVAAVVVIGVVVFIVYKNKKKTAGEKK